MNKTGMLSVQYCTGDKNEEKKGEKNKTVNIFKGYDCLHRKI